MKVYKKIDLMLSLPQWRIVQNAFPKLERMEEGNIQYYGANPRIKSFRGLQLKVHLEPEWPAPHVLGIYSDQDVTADTLPLADKIFTESVTRYALDITFHCVGCLLLFILLIEVAWLFFWGIHADLLMIVGMTIVGCLALAMPIFIYFDYQGEKAIKGADR